MQRLTLMLVVVVAACGGSGFMSGDATLTGITPPVMSASSRSFVAADGAGTMVLGWTIDFFSAGAGADCQSTDVAVVASIGIFTNQAVGSHPKAMLQTGDISIVTTSPPTVAGNAAATMGAMGISAIIGDVNITAFHLRADLSADRIEGTVSAGGTDGQSNPVAVTGTFKAPVCE